MSYSDTSVYGTMVRRILPTVLNNLVLGKKINSSVAQQVQQEFINNEVNIIAEITNVLGNQISEANLASYIQTLVINISRKITGINPMSNPYGNNFQPPAQQPMYQQQQQVPPQNYYPQNIYSQQNQAAVYQSPMQPQQMRFQAPQQQMAPLPYGNRLPNQTPMGTLPQMSNPQAPPPLYGGNEKMTSPQQQLFKSVEQTLQESIVPIYVPPAKSSEEINNRGSSDGIASTVERFMSSDSPIVKLSNVSSPYCFLDPLDAAKFVRGNLFDYTDCKHFARFPYNRIDVVNNVSVESFKSELLKLTSSIKKLPTTKMDEIYDLINQSLDKWTSRINKSIQNILVKRFNKFLQHKGLQTSDSSKSIIVGEISDIFKFSKYNSCSQADVLKQQQGYNKVIEEYLVRAWAMYLCDITILDLNNPKHIVSIMNAVGHRKLSLVDNRTTMEMFISSNGKDDLNKLKQIIDKRVVLLTTSDTVLVTDLVPGESSVFKNNIDKSYLELDNPTCDIDFFVKSTSILDPVDLIVTPSDDQIRKYSVGRSLDNRYIVTS